MSKRESVARQHHIIAKLKNKPASFDEIRQYLIEASKLEGYNYDLSKRTFHRDIEDISSLYELEITFNRSRKVYLINTEGQSEISKRVLEALDTVRIQKLLHSFNDFILFEKRQPHGVENLYGLIQAIKREKEVEFIYRKFNQKLPTKRVVQPLAVKEAKQRWYLLAKENGYENLKTFALDRMYELDITKKKFNYPTDFNASKYYKNSFGIINTVGQDPEKIELALTPIQGEYVKTFPLHESQIVTIDNDKEVRIELNLCITDDFVMEILSMGNKAKVLAPTSLINTLKQIYLNTLKQYREDTV